MMRKTALFLSMFFSISSQAMPANEPEYDCTAAETKMYIEQVTHNVFAPSPVTSPEEFKQAYVEAASKAAENGNQDSATCATIFTDGTLEEGWKDMVDTLRNLDFNISFSSFDGAILEQLLSEIKEKVKEEVMGALETLGEDICAMMSTDNIKGMLLDAANKHYGTNARNLRLRDFASSLTEDMLMSADKNILLLISEDELVDEIGDQTKGEMRQLRRELWDGF